MLAFRDHLLRHRTVEAAYLALVRQGVGRTPPLFMNQLVHVILRNILDLCDDPVRSSGRRKCSSGRSGSPFMTVH